ncbi:MAG: radical SAM protein [Eubacteriales bacterium]|nr:radical SAM protein [Eubacteriales bacterium]
MDFISKTMKNKPEVLLIYTQRMVKGRNFEAIGNLGILTLAAQLNANGFEAKAYTGITTDAMRIIEKKKDDLFAVCFYCDFDNQSAVASMICHLKRKSNFYIVIGGPQTLHMTEKDIETFQADAILKGEGEETLLEWLTGRLHGKETTVRGEIKTGKDADYVYLDDFSNYELPRDEDVLNYEEKPLLSVITARGCPHRCAFCFEGGNSKKLRMRTVEAVLNEIELRLTMSHGPRYIFFTDDTLTTNPSRLKKLLSGLKSLRTRFDFVWFCEAHPGFLVKNPELIREMIDSGMVRMQIGMESGSREVLESYGKQAIPEDIKKVVELCQKEGLPQLTGNYIIGGALETEKTLEETTQAALRLLDAAPGLLDLSTTFLMPLPGTRIYNHPEEFHIVLEDRDYITSIDDFPVNHTDALSLTEICTARARFLTKVSTRMKEQFEKGLIPKQRIKKDFQLAIRYGITGGYFKFIYAKNRILFQYYSKLIEQEGLIKEWDELNGEEKNTWIVQRAVDFSAIDIKMLTRLELECLELSGRYTIKELAEKMNLSSADMSHLLTGMSERYMIFFSRLL